MKNPTRRAFAKSLSRTALVLPFADIFAAAQAPVQKSIGPTETILRRQAPAGAERY